LISPAVRWFVLLVCLLGLAGCQTGEDSPRGASPILGTPLPSVRPPARSPTPVQCTPNPAGLALQAALGGQYNTFQTIQISGLGFLAGEKVRLVIESLGARRLQRLEAAELTVQADGSFSDSESLQLDQPGMRWQVYAVHQRGTACASFTTP
jgi:hypothetical protein